MQYRVYLQGTISAELDHPPPPSIGLNKRKELFGVSVGEVFGMFNLLS